MIASEEMSAIDSKQTSLVGLSKRTLVSKLQTPFAANWFLRFDYQAGRGLLPNVMPFCLDIDRVKQSFF